MAGRRERYAGSVEAVTDIVRPYVGHAAWLQYGEKPNSPVQPAVLVAHASMFKELAGLCWNLPFKKETMELVFQTLVSEKNFSNLQTKELQEDWVETNAKRLKLMCRHISQSQIKKPPPKWTKHFEMTQKDCQGDAQALQQGGGAIGTDDAQPSATDAPQALPIVKLRFA